MRHHKSSIAIYSEARSKIERFCQLMHFILMRLSLNLTTMPAVIATYINYYVLGLGDGSFQELPFMYENRCILWVNESNNNISFVFHPRWPFNEKTPFGFLIQSIFQFAESFTWCILVHIALSLLLGSCWLFMCFSDDIKSDLSVFNMRQRSNVDSLHVKRIVRKIIKVFSNVHELRRRSM